MTPKAEKNKKPEKETLAERSARLEAEAAGLSGKEAAGEEGNAPQDPAAELEEMRDKLLRAVAEADNTRKRAAKDREEASKYAAAGFARDLLEVADNLRRALDSVPADLAAGDGRIKSLLDGIEATERALLKAFGQHNIRKIEPLGEIFDPNFHEVMFETPGTGKPPGTIVEVMETGYALHDRLLRPARVGVAKDEGQSGEGGSDEPGTRIDTEA